MGYSVQPHLKKCLYYILHLGFVERLALLNWERKNEKVIKMWEEKEKFYFYI